MSKFSKILSKYYKFDRKSLSYSDDSRQWLYSRGNSKKYLSYIGNSCPKFGRGGAVTIITQRFMNYVVKNVGLRSTRFSALAETLFS